MTIRNKKYFFKSSSISSEMLTSVINFIYEPFNDLNPEIHNDIDLKSIAFRSASIHTETALHLVISEIIYTELYLYLYDDLEPAYCDSEFFKVILKVILHSGVSIESIPSFFTAEPTLDRLKEKGSADNIHFYLYCLSLLRDQVFAYLWNRIDFLHEFNLKLAKSLNQIPLNDRIGSKYFTNKGTVKRAYFPKWLVDVIELRENGLCYRCKRVVTHPHLENKEPHLDHLIPLALGGTNDPTNLALSCSSCNLEKSSKIKEIPDDYAWPEIKPMTPYT